MFRMLTLRFMIFVVLMASLAGCSSPPVKFGISSGKNLNPNELDQPLPVVVRVYLLSDDQAFQAAEFEELWKDDIGVLGNSLLSRQELVMTPASEQRIVLERRDGAKFAGVMAIFREAGEGEWRAIKELPDNFVTRRFTKVYRISLSGNVVEFE